MAGTSPGALMSREELASLRNEILTSLRPTMAGQTAARDSLTPFLTGAPGSSPMLDAAIAAFKLKTEPLIQQQMQLKGLGHSPAVSQVTGETLALALPEFINADMTNRLQAAQMAGGMGANAAGLAGTIAERDANLGLSGTKLSADIANQEALRALEAYKTAGTLQLGQGDLAVKAAQLQQEQQRIALQSGQAAGGLQRDISQGVNDAYQAERLRLQGLSEGGSYGIFGGSVVPPSLSQGSKTAGSSSK